MICHVCKQEAVGQCQTCLKFYCSNHGDKVCVQCNQAITAPGAVNRGDPEESPGNDLFDDERIRGIRKAGKGGGCFQCQESPSGACLRCGRLYCDDHGGRPGTIFYRPGLCDDCRNSDRIGYFLFFIVLVVGFIIITLIS